MTADDLTVELARRYGENYLRNPQIAVGIAESRGSVITLEGSVTQPGMYPVLGRTTLLQAIAMARGLHELANPRRVAIFRQVDGQRMAAAFDLTTIRAGEGPDPEVYRGDIIVVDGNSGRQTWLDVLRSLPVLSVFSPIY
jgi:polysaccharide export outer membrane protein